MATSELINSREQVDLWGTIESLRCRGMQDPVTLFGTRALVCTSRRDNERQWRHSLIVPRFLSRIEVQGGVKEDNNIELHSGEYFISVHPRLLVHLLSRLFSVARRVSFLYTYTVSFSLHAFFLTLLCRPFHQVERFHSRSSASDRTAEHARYLLAQQGAPVDVSAGL